MRCGGYFLKIALGTRVSSCVFQYGRPECLRYSGFEVREKETKEECEVMIKNHIKILLN